MGNDGHDKKRDMTYTQNRELSWLRFLAPIRRARARRIDG